MVCHMNNVVGIDLGGTNIAGERVCPEGESMARGRLPARPERGRQAVLEDIVALAKELLDHGTRAVGVGSPGLIDSRNGVVAGAVSNIPGWKGTDIRTAVSEGTKLPVFVDNDANLAALAEAWIGAARGARLCLLLTLGTGIGGGIVYEGKVFGGVSNVAAEFGHICLHPDGPTSMSGVRGILEHYASAVALERRAREACRSGQAESMLGRAGGDPDRITAKLVCDMARDGDAAAGRLFDAVVEDLAVGVGSLLNIFNPDVVVLAGGMALAGELLLDRLGAKLGEERALDISLRDAHIVTAQLGDRSGVIGAARLAWNGLGGQGLAGGV